MDGIITDRVERWLRRWTQEHCPVLYHFYKDENGYGYVLGECSGVAIVPRGVNDPNLMYVRLGEDDMFYFISTNNSGKHTYWLDDEIKCMEVAREYLNNNATVESFSNSTTPCGWKLPWNNSNSDKRRFVVMHDLFNVRRRKFDEHNYNEQVMAALMDELSKYFHFCDVACCIVETDEITINLKIKHNASTNDIPKGYWFHPLHTDKEIVEKDKVMGVLEKYHNRFPNKSLIILNIRQC